MRSLGPAPVLRVFGLSFAGEVIYIYLYDLGGRLDLVAVRKQLRVISGDFRRERKMPKYLSLKPEPLEYEFEGAQINRNNVSVHVRIDIRMYSVGALSVVFRIPFRGELPDLLSFFPQDSLEVIHSGKRMNLKSLSQELAERLRNQLQDCLSSAYEREESPEEYVVYCISNLEKGRSAAEFLHQNQKILTAVLREIREVERVSDSECESALRYVVSYSSDYLAAVDWASSFIIQTSPDYEDYVLTMELANLQLLQLRAFDKLVDRLLDKAYSDTRFLSNPPLFSLLSSRKLSATIVDIAEMRMEMTDTVDKMMNITKFFGDYVLARLYEHLSTRLHLREWQATVTRKLDMLEDLYQMASDRVSGIRMLMLEAFIVLLFLFEVCMTILQLLR